MLLMVNGVAMENGVVMENGVEMENGVVMRNGAVMDVLMLSQLLLLLPGLSPVIAFGSGFGRLHRQVAPKKGT